MIVAIDAMHPSDDYESVNFGAEYAYDDFIFIRGGFKLLFLKDSEESFSLGFGLMQKLIGSVVLKVDYAYQDFGRFSDIQKFSLSITF